MSNVQYMTDMFSGAEKFDPSLCVVKWHLRCGECIMTFVVVLFRGTLLSFGCVMVHI